ncbi:transcriptional regulator, PadR family [Seinonella peptonophila]|uniref:Transcriptional regulator, PadR family n=2 Tax=Seinonella peptonophila TaxID=112248 RepID=A0A1M4YL79_9BACL|nr:transcriptional regulator, PadR family [Seinonella peptonophila]
MHPYRMQQLIKERGKDIVINVHHRTSIYQTIERLLRDEAIQVMQKQRQPGKPDFTIYTITDRGKETVYKWLREMLSTPKDEFFDFPAAISFLALLPPEEVIKELQKRISILQTKLENSRKSTKESIADGLPRLFLLEIEYQQVLQHAELMWLKDIVQSIQSHQIWWDREWLEKIAQKFTSAEEE